jgi:Ca-activated chloride channel family protein
MTLDHDVLMRYLDSVTIGMAGEATAIGDGIGVGINRIKELQSKSKILILLTDGTNTGGKIDPLEAGKAAKTLGIKIYTIGVGSSGLVPFPTEIGLQKVKLDLDENLLKEIAKLTEGQYFRATDTQALRDVYKTIDRLEKSTAEVKIYRNHDEHFAPFLWLAIFCFMSELCFLLSPLKRIP